MQRKPHIAIVSYNLLPIFTSGLVSFVGIIFALFEQVFTRQDRKRKKSPKYVVASDEKWRELVDRQDEFDAIIIFIGKKTSGALKIIDQALADIHNKRALFFVSCPHNLRAKNVLLDKHGIPKENRLEYRDGFTKSQCKEGGQLLAAALEFAIEFGNIA